MAGDVIVERRGAVAEIRLSNPAKYNAMSLAMWQALGAHVRALCADRDVRVLLLRGEGEKGFVSGADISEFDSVRSAESGTGVYDKAIEDAQQALMDAPFPVIACIHGICMGGGLGLAMACDLRYASSTARFRMPAARLGLGYSYDGVQRMVDVIGAARVADVFMTARTFDGIEAARIGVVHAIFPAAELDAAVAEIARTVALNAPLSLRLAKMAIHAALDPAGPDASAAIAAARQACVQSSDYVEGRRAFAEKRDPVFTGE